MTPEFVMSPVFWLIVWAIAYMIGNEMDKGKSEE